MECDKSIMLRYVRDVFDNILQVIQSDEFIGNQDNFKVLKDRVNVFYLSLFHHTEGLIPANMISAELEAGVPTQTGGIWRKDPVEQLTQAPKVQKVVENAAEKEVIKQFNNLAGVRSKDIFSEINFLKKVISYWSYLDLSFHKPLVEKWRVLESMNKDLENESLMCVFFELANFSNGFANAASHMTGYLVSEILKMGKENGAKTEKTMGELVTSLEYEIYKKYRVLLEECLCSSCTSVIHFDDNVNSESTSKIEKRPMHCETVDIWAERLMKISKKLSAKTLKKCESFFSATPKMSPPTISLARPKDVQTCTPRFMNILPSDYEDYPCTWLTSRSPKTLQAELVEVPRQNVALSAGDAGHLIISSAMNPEFNRHITNPNAIHDTIQFKTKANASPNVDTAFRLYGKHGNGFMIRPVKTIHSGVDSLRFARRVITEAQHVFFHMPRDNVGEVTVKKDEYGCLLLDIYVQRDEGAEIRLLAEVLAAEGLTVPVVEEGVDEGIFKSMIDAKRRHAGLFELPAETRKFPFRPWDIQQGENPLKNQEMTEENFSMFRTVDSMYATEALLYAAPSTLNDSGIGLFLHPRLRKISAGSYLCTYATSWSSYQPSEEDGSYVLEVAVNGHTRFYDATSYDGANIGRFANENGVLEALKDVKRRSDKKKFTNFHESEWKKVNDDLAQKANACFKVHGNELHLIAKVDIQPSKTPIEIFTSYGDIRSFWIAGIVRHPENYPANMVKIVKSLFNSHRSNWTIEQKQRWGNCEDLLDENNKVCTFSEVLI